MENEPEADELCRVLERCRFLRDNNIDPGFAEVLNELIAEIERRLPSSKQGRSEVPPLQ